MPPMIPRIFGYVRTSTTLQEVSIERQKDEISRYIAANPQLFGVAKFECFFVDEESGTTKSLGDRKNGRAMLAKLRRGDHVICASPERMGRSLKEGLKVYHRFLQVKINLHYMSLYGISPGNPLFNLMLVIPLSMAEYEASLNSLRVKGDTAQRRNEGYAAGVGAPFGWQPIGGGRGKKRRWTINYHECRQVAAIAKEFRRLVDSQVKNPLARTMDFLAPRKDLHVRKQYPTGRRLNGILHAAYVRCDIPPHHENQYFRQILDFEPVKVLLTSKNWGWMREFKATSMEKKAREDAAEHDEGVLLRPYMEEL